jgi:Mannosyl-glycoprotein endo-beta-N-acetylglucosaminidase/Peptidase_C39 like family
VSSIVLNVPQYYLQTDSRTAHADRMCFSSTMAMGIKYLWPQALSGSNADDDYLRTVLKYGDTTNSAAQVRAASDYNVRATFHRNGSVQSLRDRLAAGLPVPVGFLHHGPASAPRGGGHWALVVGITDTHVIMHDPFGELDNVNGGYPRRGVGGRNVKYTLRNWLPRWEVEGKGSGWFMDLRRVTTTATPAPTIGPRYQPNWDAVEAVAIDAGARWPEVVAAQWALESGWGKHTSGKNNFFGIKGTPGTARETKEFLNGKWVTITDTFKDYPSPEACIEDLIRLWYKDYKSFKGINNALHWEEACHMLRREGYATDPDYPRKLIRLITENSK